MEKYEKIIHLPHHVSSNHPPMSLKDRAAQFAPFSALAGYEESIQEIIRETDEKIELFDEEKEMISYKLNYLLENRIHEEITLLYFISDVKKNGGSYKTYTGRIRRIDAVEKVIYFEDKTTIKIDALIELKSKALNQLFPDF